MQNGLFEKKYLNLKETAEQVGVNVQTMKKILENAEEKLYTRINRKLLVDKDKLFKYIETHNNIGK